MTRIFLCMTALFALLWASSPVAADPASWNVQSKKQEWRGSDVTFDWSVPKLLASPGDTAHWQKLLDADISERQNQFRTAYEEARAEDAEIRREHPDYQPHPWESSGGYQVVWQDTTHLILFWQGYDYRGGAHGLPAMWVTILSREQPEALLPPQALFHNGNEALQALSKASRQGLAAQFEQPLDEWALKGTEPSWENFTLVYPTHLDGPPRFAVVFPSYQVAPYAAGTPSVEIPWETLSRWTPALQPSTDTSK